MNRGNARGWACSLGTPLLKEEPHEDVEVIQFEVHAKGRNCGINNRYCGCGNYKRRVPVTSYLNTLIENWCLQVVLSLMMSVTVQQKKRVQMYLIGACLCDGLVQQQKWGKVADAPLSLVVYAEWPG